jgi:hypothetical protein
MTDTTNAPINYGYTSIRGVPIPTLKHENKYYLLKALVMAVLGESSKLSMSRVFPPGTKTIKIGDVRPYPKYILVNGHATFIECNAVIAAVLTRTVAKSQIESLIKSGLNPSHITLSRILIPIVIVSEPEIVTMSRVDAFKIADDEIRARMCNPRVNKMSVEYVLNKRKRNPKAAAPNKRQKLT